MSPASRSSRHGRPHQTSAARADASSAAARDKPSPRAATHTNSGTVAQTKATASL